MKNTNTNNNPETMPAESCDLAVVTVADLFFLKEEIDSAYREHVRKLTILLTTYENPVNSMSVPCDFTPELVRLIESRGYDLCECEAVLNLKDKHIGKLYFTAHVGMFSSWAKGARR